VTVLKHEEQLIRSIRHKQNEYLNFDNQEAERLSLNIYNHKNGYQSESNISFMWMYLFIETVMRMDINMSLPSNEHESKRNAEKHNLVEKLKSAYCKEAPALENILEFENTYTCDKAIWWYTRESPFYRQLNKALRFRDLEYLVLFQFFIFDIIQQLVETQESQRRKPNPTIRSHNRTPTYTVYRSQNMLSNEVERLICSVGKLVSMNSFMSSTSVKQVAIDFVQKQHLNSRVGFKRILFEIEVDPSSKSRPYAQIKDLSFYADEHEILFAPGTIFNIHEVDKVDEVDKGALYVVKLKLCSEDDRDLCDVLHFWQEHIEYETNQASLGWLIMQTASLDTAVQFYAELLERLPLSDSLRKDCYYGLGNLFKEKKPEEAIRNFEEAERIASQDSNDSKWLAKCYSSLASVHENKDKNEALRLYQKALEVLKRQYGEKHRETAKCHISMANFYQLINNDESAIISFKLALKSKRDQSHQDPLFFIESWKKLGKIYSEKMKFNDSLKYYTEALNTLQKNLRPYDQRLGELHESIADVHAETKCFTQALLSYHKAAEIYYYCYPQAHEYNINIRKRTKYCNKKLRQQKGRVGTHQDKSFNVPMPTSSNFQEHLPTSIRSDNQQTSVDQSKSDKEPLLEQSEYSNVTPTIPIHNNDHREEIHLLAGHGITEISINQSDLLTRRRTTVDVKDGPNLNQRPRVDSKRN
ncbi:unnamed protein product, partial [Rotaria socialis]